MRNISIKVALLSVFLMTLGSLEQAYARGAYLYCVNANNTSDAPYAQWKFKKKNPPNEEVTQTEIFKYMKDTIYESNNNIFLVGSLAYVDNHPTLRIQMGGEYDFICSNLIKACTDQYGPEYRFIGAGGGSAVLGWNWVSVGYNGDYISNATPCAHW